MTTPLSTASGLAVEALVFDFDGLIIDTEHCEYVSIAEQFEHHGLRYELAHFQKFVGSAWPTGWVDELIAATGLGLDPDELARRRRDRRDELLADQRVLPGVLDLLAAARSAGVALAVASSSSREWVEGHLSRLELRRWFDAVLTRDDVARAKPAPDLFAAAVDALGAPAGRAVAFEDSHNGCTAAKAAGLFCVVAPNGVTRVQDFSHADMVVRSLADVDLAGLHRLVDARPAQ